MVALHTQLARAAIIDDVHVVCERNIVQITELVFFFGTVRLMTHGAAGLRHTHGWTSVVWHWAEATNGAPSGMAVSAARSGRRTGDAHGVQRFLPLSGFDMMRAAFMAISAHRCVETHADAPLVALVQAARAMTAFALDIATVRKLGKIGFQGIPITRLHDRRENPAQFVLHIIKAIIDGRRRCVIAGGMARNAIFRIMVAGYAVNAAGKNTGVIGLLPLVKLWLVTKGTLRKCPTQLIHKSHANELG